MRPPRARDGDSDVVAPCAAYARATRAAPRPYVHPFVMNERHGRPSQCTASVASVSSSRYPARTTRQPRSTSSQAPRRSSNSPAASSAVRRYMQLPDSIQGYNVRVPATVCSTIPPPEYLGDSRTNLSTRGSLARLTSRAWQPPSRGSSNASTSAEIQLSAGIACASRKPTSGARPARMPALRAAAGPGPAGPTTRHPAASATGPVPSVERSSETITRTRSAG